MLFTEFYHGGCDTTFFVKYALEQDVVDIEFCPSCGERGVFVKQDVHEMDGLIVTKSDVVED